MSADKPLTLDDQIAQGLANGASAEAINILLTDRRRRDAAECRKKFFCAFLEAQAEMPTIDKDTRGYGYDYADLPGILRKVTPTLNKHGIGLFFESGVESEGDKEYVVTIATAFGHGFELASRNRMVYDRTVLADATDKQGNKKQTGNSAQRAGSYMTYGRRYALIALLGIAPDDDTDGNERMADQSQPKQPPRRKAGGGYDNNPKPGEIRVDMNPAKGDNDKAKAAGARWDNEARTWFAIGRSLPDLVERFRDFHLRLTPEQQGQVAKRPAGVIHHQHEANTPPAFADMQGDELPPPAPPKNPFIYLEIQPSVVEKLTIDQLTKLREIEKMAIIALSKTQTEPTSNRIKSLFKTACQEQKMEYTISNWLLIDVKHFH